ncbi:MAG: TlpA disulfide reductase family protein [Fimbriimonadales bacterium]
MKKMLIALPIAAVAAFALAQTPAVGPNFADLKGKKAVYSMIDTNGKAVTNETLKGKVVLIDFWATWCGPCKAASPTIQMLHEKYGKDGLVVIGANAFERTDPDGAAAGYSKEHSYTYMMTVKNDALAKSWGVKGIPAFVVIGKTGVVELAQTGFGKGKTDVILEDAVKSALATP